MMDRLTTRSHWPDGHWVIPLVMNTMGNGYLPQDGQYVPQSVIDRLAAYEDTGLTPEEIRKSDEMLRAFIEHNRTTEYPRTLDWLLNIAAAETDGRLIVLPCKVGDDVFLRFEEKIHRLRVQGISVSNSGKDTLLHFGGYPVACAWGSELGRTYFLTREEAEAALAKEAHNGE